MHPMEQLRHVARAGGGDPAAIVAATVDALVGLQPAPSELLTLCRNLLDRHASCGPLWWLCAHLLVEPAALDGAWRLVDDLADDPTPRRLADALPQDATVVVVGCPRLTSRALCERPDLAVLAVDAGDEGRGLSRRLDRAGVVTDVVPPDATLAAVRAADTVLVEADACSSDTVVTQIGSGLAAVAASAAGTPLWLVAGRGRRLPAGYVATISARVAGRWDRDFETFSPDVVTNVAGPDGVIASSAVAYQPECPTIPEL
jgi:hypothetical protein